MIRNVTFILFCSISIFLFRDSGRTEAISSLGLQGVNRNKSVFQKILTNQFFRFLTTQSAKNVTSESISRSLETKVGIKTASIENIPIWIRGLPGHLKEYDQHAIESILSMALIDFISNKERYSSSDLFLSVEIVEHDEGYLMCDFRIAMKEELAYFDLEIVYRDLITISFSDKYFIDLFVKLLKLSSKYMHGITDVSLTKLTDEPTSSPTMPLLMFQFSGITLEFHGINALTSVDRYLLKILTEEFLLNNLRSKFGKVFGKVSLELSYENYYFSDKLRVDIHNIVSVRSSIAIPLKNEVLKQIFVGIFMDNKVNYLDKLNVIRKNLNFQVSLATPSPSRMLLTDNPLHARPLHHMFLSKYPTKSSSKKKINFSTLPTMKSHGILSSSLSLIPSFTPSDVPIKASIFYLSLTPLASPTGLPSSLPSATPSYLPSRSLSGFPIVFLSASPSLTPSTFPTSSKPSHVPSNFPASLAPSRTPSNLQSSSSPSLTPTNLPSFSNSQPATPSFYPSGTPSFFPSNDLSPSPTIAPSRIPSLDPSKNLSIERNIELTRSTHHPIPNLSEGLYFSRTGPSKASFAETNNPTRSPQSLFFSRSSGRRTRFPSSIPSKTPTTALSSCDDDRTYISRYGYRCLIHSFSNCRRMGEVGYTNEEVHDLLMHCKKSCNTCRKYGTPKKKFRTDEPKLPAKTSLTITSIPDKKQPKSPTLFGGVFPEMPSSSIKKVSMKKPSFALSRYISTLPSDGPSVQKAFAPSRYISTLPSDGPSFQKTLMPSLIMTRSISSSINSSRPMATPILMHTHSPSTLAASLLSSIATNSQLNNDTHISEIPTQPPVIGLAHMSPTISPYSKFETGPSLKDGNMCSNDPLFIDKYGRSCEFYRDIDCFRTETLGLSKDDIYDMRKACPSSCRIDCSKTEGFELETKKLRICEDDISYLEPRFGLPCDKHRGVICDKLIEIGYTEAEVKEITEKCKRSCRKCSTIDTSLYDVSNHNQLLNSTKTVNDYRKQRNIIQTESQYKSSVEDDQDKMVSVFLIFGGSITILLCFVVAYTMIRKHNLPKSKKPMLALANEIGSPQVVQKSPICSVSSSIERVYDMVDPTHGDIEHKKWQEDRDARRIRLQRHNPFLSSFIDEDSLTTNIFS
uniref:ShKT domain-containing protein n=1 Tax=Corethron hystrix TaxID=216773 RepID=A0A7S1FRD5_9STRA|mmetsp:Transcript_21885/g.49773  ORF Transcript_21885/g.49773 Transcript_21885/m.49773 type:complete len:1139 (+) Transcript_21885:201-3617(+)